MELEVEIVIKGGDTLSSFYPKEYDAFVDTLTNMVFDTFPGVIGCIIGSEMTDIEKYRKEEREKAREEKLKQTVIKILKEPEIQELIKGRLAVAGEA